MSFVWELPYASFPYLILVVANNNLNEVLRAVHYLEKIQIALNVIVLLLSFRIFVCNTIESYFYLFISDIIVICRAKIPCSRPFRQRNTSRHRLEIRRKARVV